jgi:hypothetical protein
MDFELILEAERRGILPPDKAELLAEARRRGLVPAPAAAPAPPATPPGQIPVGQYTAPPAQPARVPVGQRVIDVVRPTVEALGAAGGAIVGGGAGTLAAPGPGTALGGVAGAGLGYGITKGGLDIAEQLLGTRRAPASAQEALVGGARDVLTGATFEAGGRAAVSTIGGAVGKLADIRQIPKQRAARIAREALGRDIDEVLPVLRNAPTNANVAEITTAVENPTWQALIDRAVARDPQFVRKLSAMNERQARSTLAKLAGGATETDVRAGVERAKSALNAMTGPQRETALNRANLGRSVAEYEAQAGKLSREAAAQVQEVRDLINAGNSAEAWARLDLIKRGLPVGATKYTFFGEMSDKAFNAWANKAASASLDLGQGARFSQGAADALRSAGIQPLQGEPLIRSLAAVSRNPSFAGNDLIEGSLKNVADDIAKWTNSGGIIDARALDAIRKNSVNAAIQKLRPGLDATAQRNLAAGVLTEIKPALIDAIEGAGGTGYRQYLADYAQGAQRLAERELTGKAAQLWKTNKDEFVRLVMNESPETVEKILGPGKYNIARELSENTMDTLRELAQRRVAEVAAREQATEGQQALAELLKQNMKIFRLPNRLQSWIANTNTALATLETQIGDKTMRILTEAMKTPQGAADLLSTIPGPERNRVAILLRNPAQTQGRRFAEALGRGTVTATMAPEEQETEQ